jgi:peptidoglycan/LPS O-acetylase OafA/YrhL
MNRMLLLRKPLTLAEGLAGAHDNYLLLRHVAAALLIYSHSHVLAHGADGSGDLLAHLLRGFDGGRYAVFLFFAISGVLVTNSYLRRPNLWRFIAARVLRIYPAYVVCLLVSVLLVGFAFTRLSWRDFFADAGTWQYLSHNLGLSGLRYTLPGAFADNGHYAGVVNGSLWSLALEVRLYLYLAVFAAIGLLRRRGLAAIVLAGAVVVTLCLWPQLSADDESKRALTVVFAAAAACACAAKYVPVSTRLMLLLGTLAWLLRDGVFAYGLTAACIAYFTLWFAYRVPTLPFRLSGDYSYGMFLYGFPIQQALVAMFPAMSPDELALAALALALLFAAASWHWIERRALRLKSPPSTNIESSAQRTSPTWQATNS